MKTSTSKRLRWNVAIWLAAGLFMTSTAGMAAGPIMPDPKAEAHHQPQIEETANGIPLVNITAPSSGGVSRNEYETFNVPDKGAILNNSYTLSKTELAGYVQGNNNMAERPAKIIVNEVTGAGSTSMDGFLEVAGNRADVVIANPNGITVNGGGFINTGKAFLTTGKPVYDGEDHLQRFDITGGDILIEGKGLGGKETGSLAILSRAVKINAGIWAKDLHITTGANTVDAKTLEASAIEGKGGRPAFALDTAAIGGMYAGRITLVGTEKGLGVNNSGTWSAEDNLTLDWNGDLKNSGTIYSKGNTDLRANYLENDKTIAAERNLSAAAKENIHNQGKLLAGENMDIYAGKTLNNAGHAMESGNNLSIETGDAINNAAGTIKSGGSQQIKAGHTLTNTEGTLAADGNINIQTDKMTGDGIVSAGKKAGILLEKDFTNTGRLEAGSSLSLAVKGNITNRKEILSRGHLALESKNIRNEETGEIKGADTVWHDPGKIWASGHAIRNWDDGAYGDVKLVDIIKYSINTGFAHIGLLTGGKTLTEYALKFGFGKPTGIELPGEGAGILFNPDDMRDIDVATMSIGQSIAVTPLQMLQAYSALANGGQMVKPHILRTVNNPDGSVN